MAVNFTTSYSHMTGNGTTGYTANQGVWSRTQLQQTNGPRKKKRRKWYQNFGGNPAIYQISEREEDEDGYLPLVTPESGLSQSQTISTLTPVSNVTYDDLHGELKDVFEATAIKEVDSAKGEAMECTDDIGYKNVVEYKNVEEKCQQRSSQNLEKKNISEHFCPSISNTNLTSVKHLSADDVASWRALKVRQVINSPKYTHIRVPKIHNRRSQFEISEESPFYLPKIDSQPIFHLSNVERNNVKTRKPLKVTLSKSVEQPKSLLRSRKQWNLKTLDDPVNYFESHQSMVTNDSTCTPGENGVCSNTTISDHNFKTRETVEQDWNIGSTMINGHRKKDSNCVPNSYAVSDHSQVSNNSSESVVKFTNIDRKKDISNCIPNSYAISDNSQVSDNSSESVVKLINIDSPGLKLHDGDYVQMKQDILSKSSPRKKWDYPNFWPRQQRGNDSVEF